MRLRLSLPERVPVSKVMIFSTILALVQLYQGTGYAFVLLFYAFTVGSAFAFNVAGGFSRVIGAYIFWFAMLVPIIGVFWKSVLGEAADTNLKAPLLTMTCYTASMAMLALVSVITARVDLRPVGFSANAPALDYKLASLGCLVFWVLVYQVFGFLGGSFPGLFSILRQIDFFRHLAIILGTIAVIQESGGKRSMNMVNFIAMMWMTWDGMLIASKQGMMTSFVCWLVAATYMRLKLTPIRIFFMLVVATLCFTLFSQMSQARTKMQDNFDYGDRAAVVFDEIIHYSDLVQFNKDATNPDISSDAHHYYNSQQNILIARLSMMSPDDAFFNYASTAPHIGIDSVINSYQALVPNFLLSTKKVGHGMGNHYAHEIGGYLAAEDNTTGISFSPVPEAYHLAGWLGIFFLLPGIWLLLFFSIDFVCGDLKKAPWALLVIVYLAHAAPESLIDGLVYITGYMNFALAMAIFFCTRFAPILGTLFAGTSLPNTPVAAVAPRRRPVSQPA